VLDRAIRLFPSFKPLYTNGILAARGTGRPTLAAELDRRGAALDHVAPFFSFARALRLYHEDAYQAAAIELERAHAVRPDSPVILAWLTRAYLLSGQREQGVQTFERAQQLSPQPQLACATSRRSSPSSGDAHHQPGQRATMRIATASAAALSTAGAS
jgi:tetratricopeptide (TPR) repeat protein